MISSVAVIPSMTGMLMSMITRSGATEAQSSMACFPLVASAAMEMSLFSCRAA